MFLATLLICIFVSLLCFLFGFLIWKKKKLFLIAGYNEETFHGDKDKLAKWMGIFMIGIGLFTLALPVSLALIGPFTGIIYTVVVIVATIAIVINANILNKNGHEKRQ